MPASSRSRPRSTASSSSARRTGFASTASPCRPPRRSPRRWGRFRWMRRPWPSIASLPQVVRLEAAHADEHCLEVHLPFLQELLGAFSIVPMLVGDASAEEVAEVLDRLWGGEETLIVVSSDLSHYLDYESAKRLDARTTRAIEALAPGEIGSEQACGRIPVAGLLTLARRRGLSVTTLDLRNSGDTAGDRRRVVGYGAWLFSEGNSRSRHRREDGEEDADVRALEGVIACHGQTMLAIASASIRHGMETGKPLMVEAVGLSAALGRTWRFVRDPSPPRPAARLHRQRPRRARACRGHRRQRLCRRLRGPPLRQAQPPRPRRPRRLGLAPEQAQADRLYRRSRPGAKAQARQRRLDRRRRPPAGAVPAAGLVDDPRAPATSSPS